MGFLPVRAALSAVVSTAAVFIGICACGGGDSTGPSDEGPTERVIIVTNTQLANSQLVVDDVSRRLLPAVANLAGTLELSAALSSLAQAVAGRDAQGVLDNVARGRTALLQVRSQTNIDQYPDLDAIALAFRDAELLVTLPSS
jgi:hypothetical protein